MQKNTPQASILIWSLFLTLIITVSFLSISTKIRAFLIQKDTLSSIQNTQNIIGEKIAKQDYTTEDIDQNTQIIFDTPTRIIGLQEHESYTFGVTATGDIEIELLQAGGAIKYNSTLPDASGDITDSETLTINDISSNITITNLGGYQQVAMSGALVSKGSYRVIKKIGNKEIIESQKVIK